MEARFRKCNPLPTFLDLYLQGDGTKATEDIGNGRLTSLSAQHSVSFRTCEFIAP